MALNLLFYMNYLFHYNIDTTAFCMDPKIYLIMSEDCINMQPACLFSDINLTDKPSAVKVISELFTVECNCNLRTFYYLHSTCMYMVT